MSLKDTIKQVGHEDTGADDLAAKAVRSVRWERAWVGDLLARRPIAPSLVRGRSSVDPANREKVSADGPISLLG
jgi:hypothetical protein